MKRLRSALYASFASSLIFLAPSCSSRTSPAKPGPWQPAADTAEPVSTRFDVVLAPSPTLDTRAELEPIADPISVNGGGADLSLIAHVHKDQRPDVADKGRIWIELYFVNKSTHALRDVKVKVVDLSGVDHFYDHSDDPFAGPAASNELAIPRIGKEGIGHLSIAVPNATANVSFGLELSATTTQYDARSSSPLEVSPDGAELWAPVPDADLVAIVDTATDARVAQIAVPGHPEAAALTPDGALALVVSSRSNEVRIIDRRSRAIRQTLGEADGIGREPKYVVVSPDGARAYVSSYVGDSITELERLTDGSYRVAGTLAVGRRPVGMSIAPDGSTLLVSHFLPQGKVNENFGWVSVIAANPLRLLRETRIRDDANDNDGGFCVTDRFKVPREKAKGAAGESVPSQLAGVFLNPSGTEGWVPGMRFFGQPIWEGDISKGGFGSFPITTSAMTFLLNTRDLQNVTEMAHPAVADFRDGNDAFYKCFHPRVEFKASSRVPQGPGTQLSISVAVASGFVGLTESAPVKFIGFTRGGRRALMLSRYSDELLVWDAVTHHPTSQRYKVLSGSTPNGIAITPDGKKGYVSYENEVFTSVLDLGAYAGDELPGPSYVPYEYVDMSAVSLLTDLTLVRHTKGVPDRPPVEEVGQVALSDEDPIDPEIRRGQRLFFSANPDKFPQQTSSRKAACAICHANGGGDGSLWGTMEGERRTMSLRGGVKGRGWLHHAGTHQDADEFVRLVVKERLKGTAANEGDLVALRRYVLEGIPKLQSPKTDPALVEKGKAVFQAQCAGCHAGEKYTSGNPDPASPLGAGMASGPRLYDVGSATAWAGAVNGDGLLFTLPDDVAERFRLARGDRDLGPGDPLQAQFGFRQRLPRKRGMLKAPSLEGVFDYVLFFHDGRASSLEEAVDDISARVGVSLNQDERAAVIEYLKTL